ncbi:MAG TPA: DUF3048 domain-containing protein, partial [Acidimicrobiales bacterium]|nr:DUF3048 domain-containing protein [Acidimicrobiales bacterium]
PMRAHTQKRKTAVARPHPRRGRKSLVQRYVGPALCPLTGLPAPGRRVPHRAGLAIKVENLPEARPQWGLDKADIVFEEPVEGGITRFIAVYDCQLPDRVEPVRSARLVDPQILEPLGRVLFAYSGAIEPVIDEVDGRTSLLEDVGGYKAGEAYWRDPERYAPHNLVTSASALYSAAASLHYRERPPVAIFSYGRPVPGGTPAAAVNIGYPLGTTTWTWRPSTGLWYRSYAGSGPALQGDGAQLAASNVVVMLVHEYATQYTEDVLGSHENELTLKGSGPAWVFRDGAQFYGHWERPLLDRPTVYYEVNGTRVNLTPGNTWVELVPDGLDVSVKP